MDSNNIIIKLLYYVGIASCAAQGAEKGKHESNIPVPYYIANAFGGGFIRDVIFLGVSPWLLTLSALPDLGLVIITGVLYTCYFSLRTAGKKQHNAAMRLVTFTDSLGLGSFICIGMDKALIYTDDIFTIIACGYVTAIGGGMLADREFPFKIFHSRKTFHYHLLTLLGCWCYYIFRHSLFLVCFITTGLFLIGIDYRVIYSFYSCHLITPYSSIVLLYPIIYHQKRGFQRQKSNNAGKRPDIYAQYPRIYIIQHRIRQC